MSWFKRAGRFGIVLSVVTIVATLAAEAAERRVALVIGNSGYQSLPGLTNPANDVVSVARTLRAADFEVIEGLDLDRRGLEQIVRTFVRSLDGVDVALLYYSGHGIQVAGKNYLVPTDAELRDIYDLEFEALPMEQIISYMKSGSKVQLVFMDACRDSPFDADRFLVGQELVSASGTRGLARIDMELGTLVAFAAAPGAVALDGSGELSPFTSAFSRRALTPAVEVRRVLDLIRRDVVDETGGQQVPWENSSLLTDFYFVPPKPKPIVADLHQVKVGAGPGRHRLEVPEPRQPEGGKVTVTVESLPAFGAASSKGRTIGEGDRLTPRELADLTYQWGAEGASTGLLVYRVEDAWGASVRAMVAITPEGTGAAPAAPAPAPLVEIARLETLSGAEVAIDVGVGPQPVFAKAAEITEGPAADAWLAVEALPERGILRDGDRVLNVGDSIAGARLAEVTYEPQIGTDGNSHGLQLGGADDSTLKIAATLKPRIHACDYFAAEQFDLQGVATGRFANEIDAGAAIPACLAAIATYPTVPRFFYQLGRTELARGNAGKATGLIRTAADRGHIRAIYQQGLLARLGTEGQRDETSAASYFEQAAAKGDPFGMHGLAKLLYDGNGVAEDRQRALALWLQAVEIGHTFSMNALGDLFLNGDGVKADPDRARRYFEASAARNDIYGFNNLGLYYLDVEGPERDYDKALTAFAQAYAGGHPFAARNIAGLYENGYGVQVDLRAAANWYESGARRGDGRAAVNRAEIALAGPGELVDPSFAAEMFALAITLDQGAASEDAADGLAAVPERERRRAIQRMLTQGGYDSGPVDGIVGPLTRSAAVEFATSVGTTVSGVDDDKLILALARARWITEKPRFDLF